MADVRKLLEFQRGRKHSIDFLSVEFVLQYPKETIIFSASNGQNYGKMNTWIIVKIFQYIQSPKCTGHYA